MEEMNITTKSEFIHGICTQLLFSPAGSIEGALIEVKDKGKSHCVQISMQPEIGATLARTAHIGEPLRVLAIPDYSPKTIDSTHPVYELTSFADARGHPIEITDAADDSLSGTVATLHFARHGQVNGVMLETGEFVHLRPQGIAQTSLKKGAKIKAIGEIRMTVLGTRMLDAREVNGVDLG